MLAALVVTTAVSALVGAFFWLSCLHLTMKGRGVLKRGFLEARLVGKSKNRAASLGGLRLFSSTWQGRGSSQTLIMFLGFAIAVVFRRPSLAVASICLIVWLKHRESDRQGDILEALPESLEQLATFLESGLSLRQAILLMSDESQAPVSELFRVIQGEVDVGNSMEEASRLAEERLGSLDVSLFCAALAINSRAGGSLAPLVQRVAASLRDRQKLAIELRTETIQTRLSARIVGLLPPVVLGSLWLVSPGFVAPLFNTPAGNVVLSISVAANLSGLLIIRYIMGSVENSYG